MPRGRPRKTVSQSTNEKEIQTDQTMKENVMPEAETAVTKSATKGTPPGWKPASQTPNLKAPPGFTEKWSSLAKLTERISEGWKVMRPEDNHGKEIVNIDVNDVGSLTGALRYRDLVAIMLPLELKSARDNWLRNENNEAMKGVLKKSDKELKEGGVETYVPNGQSGRIVIN